MNGIIIDVSSNNAHPITWPEVKAAGVIGVVLKATEGTDYSNPDFASDVAGATAAGLPVIAYHFADFATPATEAAHFRAIAGDRARVLDSETNADVDWQNAFLAALSLPGTEELDYGSASTLPRSGIRCPLWPASYGRNYGYGEMWQFTDSQTVDGIAGPVDASQWLGTQQQFDALFAAPATTQPTTPTTAQEATKMYYTDPTSGEVVGTDATGNMYVDPAHPITTNGFRVATLSEHSTWHAGYAESIASNPCVGITAWRDPAGHWGYAYLTKPIAGKGGDGPFDLYHFRRTGTPA